MQAIATSYADGGGETSIKERVKLSKTVSCCMWAFHARETDGTCANPGATWGCMLHPGGSR